MVDYVPTEKGTPIRQPSTANLMIYSGDRVDLAENGQPVYTALGLPVFSTYPSPWDFRIQRPNSIMNGFFTRIGVTELALEWFVPNINGELGNNTITFSVTGFATAQTITLSSGFYTVKDALDSLVYVLNNNTYYLANSVVFSIALTPLATNTAGPPASTVGQNNLYALVCKVATVLTTYTMTDTLLRNYLDFDNTGSQSSRRIRFPDLRPYRFIDFISSDLTYAQDVKDGATNFYNDNVLVRWYFDFDTQPDYDAYGFPILMGYKPFCLRRAYNPPKQIRWTPNLPIGNLGFQVVDENHNRVTNIGNARLDSAWLMTLQVSEV
jgi:hypothetical protein